MEVKIIDLDNRFDFPDKWIKELQINRRAFKATGDVNSRFKLRYKEIKQSFAIIRKIFEALAKYTDEPIKVENKTITFKSKPKTVLLAYCVGSQNLPTEINSSLTN